MQGISFRAEAFFKRVCGYGGGWASRREGPHGLAAKALNARLDMPWPGLPIAWMGRICYTRACSLRLNMQILWASNREPQDRLPPIQDPQHRSAQSIPENVCGCFVWTRFSIFYPYGKGTAYAQAYRRDFGPCGRWENYVVRSHAI